MTVSDTTQKFYGRSSYEKKSRLAPKKRRYVVIPNPGLDMPALVFTIGSDAPGIEPYKILLEHNNEHFAYTISACVTELSEQQGLRDKNDNPQFEVKDRNNWEKHLLPFTTGDEYSDFSYKSEVSLHDADVIHQGSVGVLEALLDILSENHVIARGDANQMIMLEEKHAGYAEEAGKKR